MEADTFDIVHIFFFNRKDVTVYICIWGWNILTCFYEWHISFVGIFANAISLEPIQVSFIIDVECPNKSSAPSFIIKNITMEIINVLIFLFFCHELRSISFPPSSKYFAF